MPISIHIIIGLSLPNMHIFKESLIQTFELSLFFPQKHSNIISHNVYLFSMLIFKKNLT